MTTEKYPSGWNKAKVQRVLEHYESQTDEEVAAEIEVGLNSTTMEVPRALVPVVLELIAKRKRPAPRRRITPRCSRRTAQAVNQNYESLLAQFAAERERYSAESRTSCFITDR
jgi:hypothetical protein